MDFGPYSYLKAAHISHQYRLQCLKDGLPVPPCQVHLVITNRCNHRCVFCAYRSSLGNSSEIFREADEVDWENRGKDLIKELFDIGVGGIQFTGGGEPTVHPHFEDFLSEAQSFGMDTALVTNGSLLSNLNTELLMKLSWLRISVDAATPSTYAQIRGRKPEELHSILKTLENLVAMKRVANSKIIIGVGFVVDVHNYKETGQFIEMISKTGIDNIRISASFLDGAEKDHIQYHDEVIDQIDQARKNIPPTIRIFDLFTNRLCDLHQKNPSYKKCCVANLIPYIGADLMVYSCCVRSYTNGGKLGSIEERSFVDLWKDEAHHVLSNLDARGCPVCMFNEKNKFLNYMLDDDSEHVVFI